MLRRDQNRIDVSRKAGISSRKKQFTESNLNDGDYTHRLSLYLNPPTADITVEQFEQWAIDRLKVLVELESCSFRNKDPSETEAYMIPIIRQHLPLNANDRSSRHEADERILLERKKDHYSHFILRLAFSSTEDLRRRFSRLESALFRLRLKQLDSKERQHLILSLKFGWEQLSPEDRDEYDFLFYSLANANRKADSEEMSWFKVDWQLVPELVESRRVLIKKGKAYVPSREQSTLLVSEFTSLLDKSLEATARALPRIDEDERLSRILDHLAKGFMTPAGHLSESDTGITEGMVNAASIDKLSEHFPLCMRNLHMTLRKHNHLKHYGRLQYTLFLKGIGMSMEECLLFWRQAFRLINDDTFNKEYRYNVRHAYGDVGGDSNRRGRGYAPFSCQKILTEHPPGSGESHGCPYRHFSPDNLNGLLQSVGVTDRETLRGVRDDVEKKRYHIACNRVFDWAHARDLKYAKENGLLSGTDTEVIVHPNMYFKRSYLLQTLRAAPSGGKVE